MSISEMLMKDDEAKRLYASESGYMEAISRTEKHFQKRYPEEEWNDKWKLVKPPEDDEGYVVAVNHFIKWGPADVTVWERHWSISLASWIHEFYSQISEAWLNWRNSIHLLHPSDVLILEDEQRKSEGSDDLPVRLIRFANIRLMDAQLAFKQSVSDGVWRIAYVSEHDSIEYCQGQEFDGADDDDNLNDFIRRMIATDGFPICRTYNDHERLWVHRVEST